MKNVTRRQVVKGLGAAAVVAVLPSVESDGHEWDWSPKNGGEYEYKTYGTAQYYDQVGNRLVTPDEVGRHMAEALARSMQQTKEHLVANILSGGMW